MADLALSETRSILEKDLARTQALLAVLEVLEHAAAAQRDLEQTRLVLADVRTQVDRARADLKAFEAVVPERKKAAEGEVAAERRRLKEELTHARNDLVETHRQRREEQEGRERESRAHREQQAQWAREDEATRRQYAEGQAREREALGRDLGALRRQVEAAKADLEAHQQATRELAARLAQATAPVATAEALNALRTTSSR